MAVQDEPLSNYESTGIILIQYFLKIINKSFPKARKY